MNKMYTRDNVVQSIQIVFPNQKKEAILNLLDLYGAEDYEYEKERVQLAVIKISAGDLSKLHEYIKLAKIDYRDVLMLAEYNKDGIQIKDPYREIGIPSKNIT